LKCNSDPCNPPLTCPWGYFLGRQAYDLTYPGAQDPTSRFYVNPATPGYLKLSSSIAVLPACFQTFKGMYSQVVKDYPMVCPGWDNENNFVNGYLGADQNIDPYVGIA
jgi:hypothetical protein